MIFLIDIGNSRIKLCNVVNDELINHVACEYNLETFEGNLNGLISTKPTQIIVASVAGSSIKNKLINCCEQKWRLTPQFVSVEKEFRDLINAYEQPKQLGVDRWVSMIACRQITQHFSLLVSFGTATTIDAIDSSGRHLGGIIVPGLQLMQASLINNTQEIRPGNSPQEVDDSLFGKNTYDGLQKGAVAALVAVVESMYLKLKTQFNTDIDCIITGGFASQLCEHFTIEYNYQPHIVLLGLNYWRADK